MLEPGQGSEPRRYFSGEVVSSDVDLFEAAQVRQLGGQEAHEIVGANV